MDAQHFAYWLQGFAELNEGPPTAEQWKAIRDHLQLVFNKVTPTIVSQPFKPPYTTGTPLMQDTRVECSSLPPILQSEGQLVVKSGITGSMKER